ncbi:MAG: hypothetical protein LBJ36_06175 [Synergistaceae bacterium]|nr:hypothetical protein [Synergistaceae bacterium]
MFNLNLKLKNLKLKQAIYGTKLLKIPKPDFYVLYNGKGEFPERKDLKLSDAFQEVDSPEWLGGFLELTMLVYNINKGFNEELVKRSKTLSDYVLFIAAVRWYAVRWYVEVGYELEKAIEQAVKDCVEKDILAEFLRSHVSEVINMLTLEFKMEEAVQVWKEEGREEGRKEGIEKGKEEMARNLLANGVSLDLVARSAGLSVEKIQALAH